MKRLAALCLGLFSFTGCMNEILTVHMDYISHENLASFNVGAPDPHLETALVGQRLIISWYIPVNYKECSDYEIRLKLRYGNLEEAEAVIPFTHRQGWYIYSLTNEEYFEKSGIKTYYVQLFANGELIDEWQHQLWVNLIAFPEEETPPLEGDDETDDD